ncbi:hypothetical protein D3C73_521410 [compost metagenome]
MRHHYNQPQNDPIEAKQPRKQKKCKADKSSRNRHVIGWNCKAGNPGQCDDNHHYRCDNACLNHSRAQNERTHNRNGLSDDTRHAHTGFAEDLKSTLHQQCLDKSRERHILPLGQQINQQRGRNHFIMVGGQ